MKHKKGKHIRKYPHTGAIDQSISAGIDSKQIAERFGATPTQVKNYREKEYPAHVAPAVIADDRSRHALETIIMRMDGGISKIEKIIAGADKVLADANGNYDLSNAKKSAPYVKMLIEAVKVLTPSLKDMSNIMGAVKETAEIQNNPVLILAQIGQVIQTSQTREEMIANIRRLAQDNQVGD